MTVEGYYNSFGTVIYCCYTANNGYPQGNDANDGFTPQTAVRTIEEAYSRFDPGTTRKDNIIVLMGNYTSTSYLNSNANANYQREVTITGQFLGTNYNGLFYFNGNKYLSAATTFMYLTLSGQNNNTFLYCQGYSVKFGKQVRMTNYTTVNVNGVTVTGNFFGGGNNANVNYNTTVNFKNSSIAGCN